MGAQEAPAEEQPAAKEVAPSTQGAPKAKAKGGGRRAALRILRENVETLGKDVASFRKSHEVSSKKVDKELASIRNDISALKSHISKEGAQARAKREALLTKILQKLNAPKPKIAAPKKKAAPAKKSKGKK